MADIPNTHEASASATGYLFQCRCALLAGLKAILDAPQLAISIEKFDDIGFEIDGEPTELIQTKHHVAKKGNLSDASVDLWKTLLIWTKLVASDADAPSRLKFTLLTTGIAPAGSAASFLRLRDRDEKKADALLLAAATDSKNKENADAYAAYKTLSEDSRLVLLRAVLVLDGSPNIIDVRDDIVHAVYHATSRDHLDHFVERLEGWWFGVVIKALASGGRAVPVLDIDQRVDELREEFKRNALPVDFKTKFPSQAVVAELDKRPFVRQLRKVDIGSARIEYAIRDYYRASEQRSRWAREDLLLDGEIQNYEQQLVEAWEPRHAAMVDQLAPACSPEEKIAGGQTLFKWAEQDADFPLRSVRERFLTHGSYHILSNRYAVGWHPDYAGDAPDPADDRDPK
jgi:hypothetical protein